MWHKLVIKKRILGSENDLDHLKKKKKIDTLGTQVFLRLQNAAN